MLLPCDQPYLRAAATQRPTYPIAATEYLPFDVERLQAKLIQKELKLAREAERFKQELAARYDFSLNGLFKEVDDWNYKYIDAPNLKRFLIKMGIFPSEGLLIAILRRFDLDADAKLSQKEFNEGIQPQLDFSKRQVKEKTQDKPSQNGAALTSSRVTSASKGGNKSFRRSESKGIHSSPLRQSYNTISSGQKSGSKKNARSQSKYSKSGLLGRSGIEGQFSTLQLKDQSTLQQSEVRDDTRDLQYKSLVASPSRPEVTITQERSPLRMKTLQTDRGLTADPLNQSRLQKSLLSPQSQASIRILDQSSKSGYYGQGLSDLRASRSPVKDDEGDISLIYLVRDTFREFLAIEGSLEQIKRELAVKSDFTLAGAFNQFTGYSQARIGAQDLFVGLERLGVVCDIYDAKLFVERYDGDKDGKLGFWEFSNSLMPIDPILRDDLERRKAVWELSFDTKELLRKVFRKLIDSEGMIESLRQKIHRERNLNLRKAFDTLDWLGRGYLTSNEFKRQFEQIGARSQSASQSILLRNDSTEMEGMIRRFNKDKLNGRVSLPEFLEELQPKCPEKTY